jgi:electron transfer flavoprotein alpha subunit
MSILVFAEIKNGKGIKAAFEAVSYAKKASATLGGDVVVVTAGALEGDGGFGNYGASRVLNAAAVNASDSMQLTAMVAAAVEQAHSDVIVLAHDATGKMVAPRVAVRLQAGLVAGASALPQTEQGFVVKKGVFSGKANAHVEITTAKKVLSLTPNSFGLHATGGSASVETLTVATSASSVKVREFKPTARDGAIPLPEADLVVSAGRGMKGPEHWGIVEDLAKALGAATACSRPVSDIGWRPHHEHVGQTGIAIRPTLYIAIGISGAIQHLAGVNQSKVIVVINKDPEAPFFKAADYGIVGDAFEVLPKLLYAVKAFKAN